MVSLIPLEFEATEIRTVEIDGVLWWVATDIAKILGYRSAPDMTRNLKDYQKTTTHLVRSGGGGGAAMAIINESGLYSSILRSKRPEAEAFERWIVNEVIPSIRKYGFYDPKRLNVKEVEKLEAEPHEEFEKAPNERFWDEIKLYEARYSIDYKKGLEHIISKQTLTAIEYGTSIISVMKKRNTWFALASLGFDIKYIIWGIKELTEAEKKIIAAFRIENKDNRQKAIAATFQTEIK